MWVFFGHFHLCELLTVFGAVATHREVEFLSYSSPKTDLTVKIINSSCSYLLSTFLCLFQVNANELTNGVINAAFMLLFKDAIRLFAAYNEGIINLLGKDKLLLLDYTNFTLQLFRLYSVIKGSEND